jgi:hypothetical protein
MYINLGQCIKPVTMSKEFPLWANRLVRAAANDIRLAGRELVLQVLGKLGVNLLSDGTKLAAAERRNLSFACRHLQDPLKTG